jgi:4-oxalocrotonate tautomerase
MPHVIIKMYPGRSEDVKNRLVSDVAEIVQQRTGCPVEAVSVAVQEIPSEQWPEKVYRPDILESEQLLYRKPGYNPFEK